MRLESSLAIGTAERRGVHRWRDAIVVRLQIGPDTPNQPAFGSARPAPGRVRTNAIRYRLTAGELRQ
jgi:aldose 1-epimerase